MSLLLEALKKAEKAKEEAQKRAREGGEASAGELRLADEPAPGAPEEKRVVTRDELPPITAPLEIQSDDLGGGGTPPGAGPELSLQAAPRAAGEAPSRPVPQAQSAQRAAARKPFEAKVREPNPRMPFYITMGVLGVVCIGTVVYFWLQLSSPPSIYVKNPKPPADERAVEVKPPAIPAAGASTAEASGAIPGLPPAAPAPVPASTVAQAPSAPPAAAPAPKAAAPAPRVERPAPPRPRVRKSVAPAAAPASPIRPTVSRHRPVPTINPNVSAGYAAYQAGDMERARRDYEAALREDPADRDALLGLAAVETRARQFAQAEGLYRRVLEIDPRDPHAQAGLVALRTGQQDPVSAETQLKGLIAVESRESVLYFSLGNQFAQQSRWAEARQAYAKAVAIDPENPDFAYNYAVSLEHARDTRSALQQYRRALSLGLRHTPSFDLQAAEARVQALSR